MNALTPISQPHPIFSPEALKARQAARRVSAAAKTTPPPAAMPEDASAKTSPPAPADVAPDAPRSETSYVKPPRGQRPRNPEAPLDTRTSDDRMRAEHDMRRRTKGMPDGLREAMGAFDASTGTAELNVFLAALLDLNDPRLLDIAKDEMTRKGVLKPAAFNELRKRIEGERKARALAADNKKQAAQGGCRVDKLDFMDVVDHAREVIQTRNAAQDGPAIFLHGSAMVRLAADPYTGARSIDELDKDGLSAFLTRHGRWRVAQGDKATRGVRVPLDVAGHILADVEGLHTYPALNGILVAPAFGPDGVLIREPGFDKATGLYYAPPPGFVVPEVPAAPSAAEVEAARMTLMDSFADFPFEGMTRESLEAGAPSPDFAHVVAWMLTPLIRPLLGPTALAPALHCGKSSYGVGASKVLTVAQLILAGTSDLRPSLPRHEAEQGKEIIAALASSRTFLCFDNANDVGGGPLAALLTSNVFSGRTLGRSETRSYPNRLGIAFTGVNTVFSKEMQRRLVLCWLDAGVENAHERPAGSFRHSDLESYVLEHRGALYHALCVLVQAWLARGRPAAADGAVLASFEPWSRAVGGILEASGIRGFLGNRALVAARTGSVVDVDDAARAFVEAWLAPPTTGPKPSHTDVRARDLADLANAVDLDLDVKKSPGDGGVLGFDPKEFGRWLGRIAGRVFDLEDRRWRIVRSSDARARGGTTWSLVEMQVAPSAPEATPAPMPARRGSRPRRTFT